MLTCKLCGFTGDPDQYCYETPLFLWFFRVGGSGPLVTPLDPRMQQLLVLMNVVEP